VYNVPKVELENETLIVNIAMLLDSLENEHTKSVVQIEEYLGNIAGIQGLLISISLFFFGNYMEFQSKLKWIKELYEYDDNNRIRRKQLKTLKLNKKDHHRFKLTSGKSLLLYLKKKSLISCLYKEND